MAKEACTYLDSVEGKLLMTSEYTASAEKWPRGTPHTTICRAPSDTLIALLNAPSTFLSIKPPASFSAKQLVEIQISFGNPRFHRLVLIVEVSLPAGL